MADKIRIEFTRFSAFYSPLIATMAGGFLKHEGLDAAYSVSAPGKSAIGALLAGTADVVQSAPSANFTPLEKGETPKVRHFAQVNEKDGFFIAARRRDANFSWNNLARGKILADHGGQPLAMFKYACAKQGVDFNALDIVDAGNVDEIDAAFRAGQGDYVHQQGPAPQQLEHDGVGDVVASLGEAIGPCAFSSLCATPDWLGGDMARAFTRAYREARAWLVATPASEVARAEQNFFPDVHPEVLEKTIAAYQRLGCWTPHIEITRSALDVTIDVFLNAGLIKRRHAYEDVVAPPPR